MYQQCLTSMEKLKNLRKRRLHHSQNSASCCPYMEDYEKSEAAMRRAIRITELLFDEDHPETLILLMQLSHLLLKGGKYQEAENICKRVLEMRYKILGNEHADIVETLVELYKICKLQENETEAEIYQESAVDMADSLYGKDSSECKEIRQAMSNFDGGMTISGKYERVNQKTGKLK
ncbi:MAG: tetratricopeptide repeat protein [Cyanobacteriota/Melainabacteria group bacterium]